jgi:hypothetical protein
MMVVGQSDRSDVIKTQEPAFFESCTNNAYRTGRGTDCQDPGEFGRMTWKICGQFFALANLSSSYE